MEKGLVGGDELVPNGAAGIDNRVVAIEYIISGTISSFCSVLQRRTFRLARHFATQRERPAALGITKSINSGRDRAGRLRSHTVCGILMHSSLAVTTEGLPLGLRR